MAERSLRSFTLFAPWDQDVMRPRLRRPIDPQKLVTAEITVSHQYGPSQSLQDLRMRRCAQSRDAMEDSFYRGLSQTTDFYVPPSFAARGPSASSSYRDRPPPATPPSRHRDLLATTSLINRLSDPQIQKRRERSTEDPPFSTHLSAVTGSPSTQSSSSRHGQDFHLSDLGSSDGEDGGKSPRKPPNEADPPDEEVCHSVSGDFGIQTVHPGEDSDSEIRFSGDKKALDVNEAFPKPLL
jgi:hypothetical protein